MTTVFTEYMFLLQCPCMHRYSHISVQINHLYQHDHNMVVKNAIIIMTLILITITTCKLPDMIIKLCTGVQSPGYTWRYPRNWWLNWLIMFYTYVISVLQLYRHVNANWLPRLRYNLIIVICLANLLFIIVTCYHIR